MKRNIETITKIGQSADLYYFKLKDHTVKFDLNDESFTLHFSGEDFRRWTDDSNCYDEQDYENHLDKFLAIDNLLDNTHDNIAFIKDSLLIAASDSKNIFVFAYDDKNYLSLMAIMNYDLSKDRPFFKESLKTSSPLIYRPGLRRKFSLLFEKK